MSSEVNRKFREIKRKCNNKNLGHYPSYCHRAVLDLLELLNMIREETASNQNAIENLSYLDGFIKDDILLEAKT